MGPLPPIPVTLSDGVERQFRLSLGIVRRLRVNHKIDMIADPGALMNQPVDVLGAILWEGLTPRPDTVDDLLDMLDLREISVIAKCLSDAMRDPNSPERPTTAAPVGDAAQPLMTFGPSVDTISD